MTQVRRLSFALMAIFFLLAAFSGPVSAQNKVTVKGTVMDEMSQPVPGAAVMAKGASGIGTVTDGKGNFEISLAPGTTLEVSALGYKNQERRFTQAGLWTVVLETDSQLLDDVVVVGYGVQKKESVVGAISTVNSEALVKSGQTNITNAIAGKLSGVQTFQTSGQPGSDDATIYIRGLSSLNSNAPLIMVDGVERSFSDLDPNEVDNISVLKDASATAVFGAKGANGVILVTTKTGVKGKPRMGLSVNYGLENPQTLPGHIDAETTLNMYNIALRNTNSFSAQIPDSEIAKYVSGENPIRYPDTDWYDLMLRDFATNFNASYNVSGGGERVKYYANVGYNREGSIVKRFHEWNDKSFSFDRINYRLNLDFKITGTTDLAVKIGGNTNLVSQPDNVTVSNLFTMMYRASGCMFPAYFPEYALEMYPDPDYPDFKGFRLGDKGDAYYDNPFKSIASGDYSQTTTNQLATDISLTQKLDFITKGLSAKGKAAYTTTFARTSETASHSFPKYRIDWTSVDSGEGNPWVSSSGSETVYVDTPYSVTKSGSVKSATYNYYWEASLNYARSFSGHNVSAMALMNQRSYVSSAGFPSRSEAHVGRLNYDYKGTYLLEANISRTGSEQFAPANRYGVFPSVAVGYVPSKYNWWKQTMPWWNKLKIRYSDGYVGSDIASGSWLYFSSFSRNGDRIIEDKAANASARWEMAHKRDLGFEFGFFDDSLVLDVDLFDEHRDGMLLNPSASVTMLVEAAYQDINAGEMKKHGMDIELKWRKTTPGGFFYEVGGMVGLNENRILKYTDAKYSPEYQKRQGKAIGSQSTGETPIGSGYFTSVEDIHSFPCSVANLSRTAVGIVKFLDYNSDGSVDANDLHPVEGSTVPPVTYSGHINLQYKGFSLYAMLYGVSGKYIQFNRSYFREFSSSDLTIHAAQANYWTPDNPNPSHATPSLWGDPMTSMGGDDSNGYKMMLTGQTWRKSDYLSLKEVNLSYRFPDFNGFLGIKGAVLTLTGNNLMTWSSLIEGDPEVSTLSNSYYPLMRNVKLGVKLDF